MHLKERRGSRVASALLLLALCLAACGGYAGVGERGSEEVVSEQAPEAPGEDPAAEHVAGGGVVDVTREAEGE